MIRKKKWLTALTLFAVVIFAMFAMAVSITDAEVTERREATAAFIATMHHLAGTATMSENATYNAKQALLATPGTPTPTSLYDAYIKAVDERLEQLEK